jgi:Mg2+ and Co2+ transporter CorA
MDEGWRFVPVETAKDRMQLRWRTRDFFNVIAFEETVAVINLEQRVHHKYVTSQRQLKIEYDHEPEPYFEFPTKIAGLKNGVLLKLENAFLQLFIIDQISDKFEKKGKAIREIETFRNELLTALQNLSCVNIPEIDLLEKKVLKAMKVPKGKKELQNKLEQVENSLVLKYNQRFNRLILWLTVVGTIVAVLTILNGIGIIPKI